MSTPWFRAWFGEEYLKLYPHRDEEEAHAAVRLFLSQSPLPKGARLLDLACGAGRHLKAMHEAPLRLVGLDLSLLLLRRAEAELVGVPLVRGDMRNLPFADGVFTAVTSFFTSFGYFKDEEEDRRMLSEVRRVLASGGSFLLDFLDAEAVRRTLVPRDERMVGERRVVQERRLIEGGRVVEKRIRMEDDGAHEFVERVRLYGVDELEDVLHACGLETWARFGDYTGTPHDSSAERAILLARAGG